MPRYANRNSHPVVVSITEPRISLTVFPAAWSKHRLPVGARQDIELDETLARAFVRTGMLTLIEAPALPVATPTTPAVEITTVASIDLTTPLPGTISDGGPEDISLVDTSAKAVESNVSVTEENVSPADLALRANSESQRVILRQRPPSPPRRKRYAL